MSRFVAGLASLASIGLTALLLLAIQKNADLAQMVMTEQMAHSQTKLAYVEAQALAAQKAQDRVDEVYAQQSIITQEISDAYSKRMAAARADADRLRADAARRAAESSGGRAGLPGALPPAGGTAEAADPDRLPLAERLLCTEQAIQLDELITAVIRGAEAGRSNAERNAQ